MGLAIIEGGLGPTPSGVEVMESADRGPGRESTLISCPAEEILRRLRRR